MNLNLRDVLLHRTEVGDLVLIRDYAGWQIGCAMIDDKDWFIDSLDDRLLNLEVKNYYYRSQDWTTKNVMIVELK